MVLKIFFCKWIDPMQLSEKISHELKKYIIIFLNHI